MKKFILAVFLIFSLAFLVSSCATTKHFTVQIDSIGADIYQDQKAYIALPTEKDVKADDLRFKEYAGYVRKILAKKGYVEVNSLDDANIVVYLTYGVGDPEQHTYVYSLPVYGQVGVVPSPGPGPAQPSQPPHKPPFGHFSPIFGIVGTKTEYQTVTTYFRYCKIEAFDLRLYRTTGTEKQLWSIIITSRGESDDLRMVMPYMLAAAEDYIGVDTGRKVEVVINGNDERALSLKR